ncbi:endonuclease/exonuclease/phosphatase family protein [Leucobacter sp. CSA2]|uniref:Endonuclease/exonuclease/phosphatase family protein n=1 Tax=Leucobacter edaphi TaxID=2796472 RepID=A0A934QBH8_9MICO|nr:endonuclease/exonuclease/phosphatase family protein [Leucobacter edaphi]MBK0421556.1 endonuclease/exonuclease/phosphatase family protein [Leucobacter edaphi]
MNEPQTTRNTADRRSPRDPLGPFRLITGLILAAGTAILLVLVLAPELEWSRTLSETVGIAHALAFARITGGLLALIAALSLLVSLIAGRRGRRRGSFRAYRPLYRLIGVALLGTGIALMIWPAGWVTAPKLAADAPPSGSGLLASGEQELAHDGKTITMVVYNSQGTLDWDNLRSFEWSVDPDLYILPEASAESVRTEIAPATAEFVVHETRDSGLTGDFDGSIPPTTILSRSDRITLDDADATPTTYGSVAVRLANDPEFTILGVHAAPPLPSLMPQWRADLHRIAQAAESDQAPSVIAGDFNATLRHGPLANLPGYRDATLACAPQGVGTWPANIPETLSAPIDHVLIRDDLTVHSCNTVPVGRGDHRAVIVTIER